MKRGFLAFLCRTWLARVLRSASLAALALGLLAGFAPSAGCSSSTTRAAAPPACDSSKCARGNQCIDDGSGAGPTCHEVCTAQTCPFGWYCNDGMLSGQPADWCVQGTTPLTAAPGQWGTPCSAAGGETNPACDTADGFYCYGLSPTDANAFCTIFHCAQDSDCPGGWWCETVDVEPSLKTANRTFGQTQSVCKPRDYCSTCRMDHDCPLAADGTQQHCAQAPGASGDEAGAAGSYCTPQCASNANCPLDATCVTQWPVCTPAQGPPCHSDDDCPPADGTYQHCDAGTCTPECGSNSDCTGTEQTCTRLATCQPRAGTCLGAGGFCSPCRSDADCTDHGYCLYADYSTERYCSVPVARGQCPPSTTAGVELDSPTAGQCPAAPKGSAASVPGKGAVGCTVASTADGGAPSPAGPAPSNQCVALTALSDGNGGELSVVGCWTVNR
jgi:hypothetical protein